MFVTPVVGVSILRLDDFEVVSVPFVVLLFVFSFIIHIIFFMRGWYFARRRIIGQKITAEYEAPLGLNPAEMSYLFRRRLSERDFAALLVHMSQKGIIHFRKHEGNKIILPGPKFEGKLKPYERMILTSVDENRSVKVVDLVDNYYTIFRGGIDKNSFTEHVKHELVKKGYISPRPIARRSFALLKAILSILVSFVWLPLFALWLYSSFADGNTDLMLLDDLVFSGFVFSAILFVPVFILVVFVIQLRSNTTGRAWIVKPKLKGFWPQIVGFRQFVRLAEKQKLRFETKSLEKQSSINTLPYAVSLGFVKNWRDIIS